MNRFLIVSIILTLSAIAAFGQTQDRIIQGGVLNGKAVRLPKPTFPDEAKIAKAGGTVEVAVLIDEGGNVISAKRVSKAKDTAAGAITESQRLRALLEDAAESAARLAKFSPTLVDGTPVKVSGQIVYNFLPGDSKLIESDPASNQKRNIDVDPSTISGGILNGKAVKLPVPSYPPAAAAVNAGGTVEVFVVVDENGDVIQATATSGHPLLLPAAVAAARSAKFAPTLLGGKLVKVSGVITYTFVKN
jgi:TonB family protein